MEFVIEKSRGFEPDGNRLMSFDSTFGGRSLKFFRAMAARVEVVYVTES